MAFEIPEKQPAKILKSVRLSVKAADLLDQLTEAYGTNDSLAVEGLINTFAPNAIKEGALIERGGKK